MLAGTMQVEVAGCSRTPAGVNCQTCRWAAILVDDQHISCFCDKAEKAEVATTSAVRPVVKWVTVVKGWAKPLDDA